MKMNVLFLTPIYFPLTGGSTTYSDILVRYLARKKKIKKFIILTKFTKKAPIVENRDKIKILRLLLSPEEVRFLPPKVSSALCLAINPAIIFFVILLFRINVVHNIFFFNFWIPKIFRIPVIMDVRGMGFKKARFSPDPTIVLCVSENVLAKQTKLYSNDKRPELKHIPLPFEPPEIKEPEYVTGIQEKYSIPSSYPYICFTGAIADYKGVYELVDAFKIFLRAHLEYYLVLAGKDKEGKEFRKKIKDNEHIIYVGEVSHDEAMAIVQGSEMLVLPSKSEGLPRSPLEAIALRKKVICPPIVAEFRKYCPDFVLDEIEPRAIAAKMEEVMNTDRKLEYPLEELNPERAVDKIYEIYKELRRKRAG